MRPRVDDEYLIPPKRRWSRVLSASIAVAYVVGAYLNADIKTTIEVCMFCVLPLGCIWFPQALGDYVGFVGSGRFITAASPAGGIAFMGWVLLLLPAVVRGIAWLMGVNLDVF
jgi:hypothetical protein